MLGVCLGPGAVDQSHRLIHNGARRVLRCQTIAPSKRCARQAWRSSIVQTIPPNSLEFLPRILFANSRPMLIVRSRLANQVHSMLDRRGSLATAPRALRTSLTNATHREDHDNMFRAA